MTSLEKITKLLDQQNIINMSGTVTFNFAGITVNLGTKDIVGSVLQEWFANWMQRNNIFYRNGVHSQNWPDFILEDGTDLEVKAFDGSKSPNFDLANFDTYVRSLLTEPQRLDTDHLIFEYHSNDYIVTLTNFYTKKIWEMTGPSSTNILNLQKKQDVIYNIRPKNWRSQKVDVFDSRLDFVECLAEVISSEKSKQEGDVWLEKVIKAYNKKTNQKL